MTTTLVFRRLRGDMIKVFKILSGRPMTQTLSHACALQSRQPPEAAIKII